MLYCTKKNLSNKAIIYLHCVDEKQVDICLKYLHIPNYDCLLETLKEGEMCEAEPIFVLFKFV